MEDDVEMEAAASEHWLADWKTIIDTLLMFIQHPKKIKSHLRMALEFITSYLEEKPDLFCPSPAAESREKVFRAYEDFVSTVTNCFLIMLAKDLEFSKAPGISSFYQKLMRKLCCSSGALFVYLMGKFMSSLKNIYVNSVEFYPPISVGTFAVAHNQNIPEGCRSVVRLSGLSGAKSPVSFLTDVVLKNSELVLESPLRPEFTRLVMQRLEAWDHFSYEDISAQEFLLQFPFHEIPELMPRLSEICIEILSKKDPEKNPESLVALKEKIAQLFLREEIPMKNLTPLIFLSKLKSIVLSRCTVIDATSSMSQLLCKVLRSGLVELSELEIKWLAQNFSLDFEVPGHLLLAFMESELRRAVHRLQTVNSGNSAQQTRRSLNQNWHNADEHSKAWQILQHLLLLKLDGLVQMEGAGRLRNAAAWIHRLHLVVWNLRAVSVRLELEQKSGADGHIAFWFFPIELEKLVAQVGVLPNHCLEMPAPALESWRHLIEMLNALRALPEATRLEPASLACIEVICGLPWLTQNDKLAINETKLEWFQHLAELFQKKLQTDAHHSNDILELFTQEFSKTRSRPSPWRIQVYERCLLSHSDDHLPTILKALPVIITSCQRSDIPKLFSAFSKTAKQQKRGSSMVKSVAEVLPGIVCALSGCCEIVETIAKNSVDVKISCSECSPSSQLSGPKGWNYLNLLGNFSEQWKGFLSHQSVEIRRALVEGFPHIQRHLGKTFKLPDWRLWLKFLSDEDSEVAEQFAGHLPGVLALLTDPSARQELFDLVLGEVEALVAPPRRSWAVVGRALAALLDCQDDWGVHPLMRLMVKLVALQKEDVCFVNRPVMSAFCRNNRLVPMVLFFHYQDENWRTILATMALQKPEERNIVHCFSRICNVFSFKSPDMLKKHLYRFLQVLIPKCFEDASFLHVLADTAHYLGLPQQTVLQKWHSMLYPSLVVNEPACVDFYLKLSNCEEDAERYFTLIIIQVVLRCHESSAAIQKRLRDILKELDGQPDNMSQLLQAHFLGVLEFIQNNVLNKYASSELKLRSLQGFSSMLGLMQKEAVTLFHGKILDALCTFKRLDEPVLVRAYCKLLLTFLNSLEDDKVSVVFFTVLTNVSLLDPDVYRQEATQIISFFMGKNKKKIKSRSQDLFNLLFLFKRYGFDDIVKTCENHMENTSCEENLSHKLNAISNNYVENQILALKELNRYLKVIQSYIQEVLFSHSRVCSDLNQIIGRLITGASSANADVRLLSIECLSKLGAIDPGHWIISHGFKQDEPFFFDSSCSKFVCRALEKLVDGFQATTSKSNMDIIGYVCQEFMKANDFQDEPAKAPVQIWNQFSEQAKSTLMPFFTSTYIASLAEDAGADLPHPLLGSRHAQSYEEWLFSWVLRLTGMVPNRCVRQGFEALRLLFKINLRGVTFFLPHIFTHALWAGDDEDQNQLLEEMALAAGLSTPSTALSEDEALEAVFQALSLRFDMQSFVDCHSQEVARAALADEHRLRCAKTVFFLLDYLLHWNLEYEQVPSTSGSGKSRSSLASSSSESSYKLSTHGYKYKINKAFLAMFNLKTAAEQSHSCNENFRALRYLEMHCLQHAESIDECCSLLLQIHSQLQNTDFVHGISCIQKGATARHEQLLLYEMSGQSQESIIMYEKMLANREGDPHEIIVNMTKAHLQLEQYQPVLGIVAKYTKETPNAKFRSALLAAKLETHWRMGAWEHLDQTLEEQPKGDRTWAYCFAKILVSAFRSDHEETSRHVKEMREVLGEWLHTCGANSSSYANNYPAFLLMHLLADVEIVVGLLEPKSGLAELSSEAQVELIRTTIAELETRQKRVSYAWKGLQAVLAVRRTLLALLQHQLAGFHQPEVLLRERLGQLWLESAKIAINERQFPQALGYLISSEQCGLKETFILQAQLQWESGAKELALIQLRRGICKHFPDSAAIRRLDPESRKICAKAKRLVAEYSTSMKIVDMRKSISMYREATSCFPRWEESWIHLARALDVIKNNNASSESSQGLMNEIVKSYTNALSFGVSHLYESLPRVITIWANTGAKLHNISNKKLDKNAQTRKEELLTSFNTYNDNLVALRKKLPPYAFYACFNSLSSRFCHPYEPVYTFIHDVFVSLLHNFPSQMLWKLVPMLKVSHMVRVNRVQKVLLKFGTLNPEKNKMMNDYLQLCSYLFDLGHKAVPGSSSRAKMSTIMPALVEFFKDPNRSKILMPTDELLSVVLPTDNAEYQTHNAFPREPVYITSVLEPVAIIASLQKPKKFTLAGSDDNEYSWLVKNKDDLRIDASVMHFMQVLNSLLDQEPECRERHLNCKTYSVVPLGEDCGLIEFLPNLITVRQVIMSLYKGKGIKNETREELRKNDSVDKKMKVFENSLLPAHPPVLPDWFHWRFPDHSAWNEARKRYILSSAVMSMVGYVIGLGDRHGGNILLSETTGESVHVDYNCVFNKGETLPWPEKVPFRLTHNMVKTMGVGGLEGPYRKAAELTLRVMRHNSETLLSVLRPIMYDATSKDRLSNNSTAEEPEFYNKGVMASLMRVKMRLSGHLNDTANEESAAKILSPEGHAKAIISQATSVQNLCQMYPGWGAFL